MTRGLTLIEVLISLTLLTAVVSASAAWTAVAGHATSTSLEPARWRSAAMDVLQLIHDDIATGDFEPKANQVREKETPKVTFDNGTLSIRTRIAPPEEGVMKQWRVYQLDAMTHVLEASTQSDSEVQRPLLIDVNAFTCAIDEERKMLTVSIASVRFGSLSRSYSLP